MQSDGVVALRNGFLMALMDKTHVTNMPQHVGSTGQHVASFPLSHQPVTIESPGESLNLCTPSSFFVPPFFAVYFQLVFGSAGSN